MSEESFSDASFLSVGLDIGTTTTHLVISRLTVGAGEDPFGRHHLLDKEIVYRGHIHLTPMCNGNSIDADAIHDIVMREYANARVSPEQVLTGAVIVTGETALKANAEAVVQRIAGESSSFAAAVAGANAESILAGRGSGAAEHSRRHHCCVLNVDVGGGTSNFGWFVNGEPVAAGAIRVGGRHLLGPDRAKTPDHRVVSETARQFLGRATADAQAVQHWISHSAKLCCRAVQGDCLPPLRSPFTITWPPAAPPKPDAVFISGGVGELMARIDRGEALDATAFDDTGPQLAQTLYELFAREGLPVQYPAEPIRATVIGAGQFAMMFSGETLWADPTLLPLRNLPVIRLPRRLQDVPDAARITLAIQHARKLRSIEADQVAAIVLPSLRQADWDTVVHFAQQLTEAAGQLRLPSPWVFTMRDNFGRLLGRSIAERQPDRPVVVIDEIDTDEADFIDIGRPVERSKVLIPVVAKTLVFGR
jgi:ethanolamine utilization protein EutA